MDHEQYVKDFLEISKVKARIAASWTPKIETPTRICLPKT